MSTFDGFIREFQGLIRVDNFQQSGWLPEGCRPSLVYLLSHAHSDHMVGLEKHTSTIVYCSEVTQDIVLKIRPARARINDANGFGSGKIDRTYKNLLPCGPEEKCLLKPLKLHAPEVITLNTPDLDKCRITLIPANHCPGSVMFLIQMWNINVLYTGDIRAEPWWVDSLKKDSELAPFIAPHQLISHRTEIPQMANRQEDKTPQMHRPAIKQSLSEATTEQNYLGPSIRLDNIYLDTSSLLTKIDVLTKADAIQLTIKMMSAYPDDTNFFINSWTWGYEHLLQEIAVYFKSFIHVDKYKYEIFRQPHFRKEFPLLFSSITLDSEKTRFHACERNLKCPEIREEGGKLRQSQSLDSKITARGTTGIKARVVCVNPWEITTRRWNPYKAELDLQLAIASRHTAEKPKSRLDPWPPFLICPLTRHSSFREILNFVSIFQPKCIFPNTTHAFTGFVEFYAIPKLFASLLDSEASQTIARQASQFKRDYEIRHHEKIIKNPMSVEMLDWKGIHYQNLEKAFQKFEEIEFSSEKYRSMWKEFFQTIDQNDKQKAARFIEGQATENATREESPEICVISSSDEEDSSPSQTAAATSDTEPAQSSQTSEFVEDVTSEDDPSDVDISEDGTSGKVTSMSRPMQRVHSVITPPSRIPPSSTTSIPTSSTTTVKGGSSPTQDPSSSGPSSPSSTNWTGFSMRSHGFDRNVNGRSLSNLAAGLQLFEYQFLRRASILTQQLCSYYKEMDRGKRYHISDGSPQPKKRKTSSARDLSSVNHQARMSPEIIEIDSSEDGDSVDSLSTIWIKTRRSIVRLMKLRRKICLYRNAGVERMMPSSPDV